MAILWTSPSDIDAPRLEGRKVYLRAPQMSDYADWAGLREESRAFLTRWEPLWPVDDLTRTSYRHRLKHYARDRAAGQAYPFFVLRRQDDVLLGGCSLSSIRHGVMQSGTLGYWMGAPHARKGYMSDALSIFIPYAFDTLGLHRIEAACLPENEASQGLLRRIGFSQEGYARQYLRINGGWCDHVLFAMLSTDPRGS